MAGFGRYDFMSDMAYVLATRLTRYKVLMRPNRFGGGSDLLGGEETDFWSALDEGTKCV